MSNINQCDLFWFLGVLHTDCYIYRNNGDFRELRLRVGPASVEMLLKWKKILDSLTGKRHNIIKENYYDRRYNKNRISFCVREGSKPVINNLIIGLPITDSMSEEDLGAYLAGVIDGDGCVQIRKRYSDRGYEKLIKIAGENSEKLMGLQELLLKESLPKGYITSYKNHSDLWIYINKEFDKWLRINTIPHISITSKLLKLVPRKRLVTDANCPGGERQSNLPTA